MYQVGTIYYKKLANYSTRIENNEPSNETRRVRLAMAAERDPRASRLEEDPFERARSPGSHTKARDDGNWRQPHVRVPEVLPSGKVTIIEPSLGQPSVVRLISSCLSLIHI